MEEIKVKKITVSPNMYVLCVPDENNYYRFHLCHKKYPAILNLFGTTAVRDPGDDVMELLAKQAWRNSQESFLQLTAFIDSWED